MYRYEFTRDEHSTVMSRQRQPSMTLPKVGRGKLRLIRGKFEIYFPGVNSISQTRDSLTAFLLSLPSGVTSMLHGIVKSASIYGDFDFRATVT